jgi:hypothetical protein
MQWLPRCFKRLPRLYQGDPWYGDVEAAPVGCTALTAPEWQTLWDYEATFGIRQVSWYTYPSATYGFNPPTSSSENPSSASLTPAGQSVFAYINPSNPISINNAWTYLATPLDANTTPLLTDNQAHALAAVRLEPDSTQSLAFTFDSNYRPILALSYGNQLGDQRTFLGCHAYMSPQPDDLFIDNDEWVVTTLERRLTAQAFYRNPETSRSLFGDEGAGNNQFSANSYTAKNSPPYNPDGT